MIPGRIRFLGGGEERGPEAQEGTSSRKRRTKPHAENTPECRATHPNARSRRKYMGGSRSERRRDGRGDGPGESKKTKGGSRSHVLQRISVGENTLKSTKRLGVLWFIEPRGARS